MTLWGGMILTLIGSMTLGTVINPATSNLLSLASTGCPQASIEGGHSASGRVLTRHELSERESFLLKSEIRYCLSNNRHESKEYDIKSKWQILVQ